MPRMQAAQWRARDVSRKTALSQVQSAIVTSQWDKWRWPGCGTDGTCVITWQDLKDIESQLQAAWMSSLPTDPIQGNEVVWIWGNTGSAWEYRYLVTKRNWSPNWWFVLMAKTEVEWWSNWVTCLSGVADNSKNLEKWYIKYTDDVSKIHICSTVSRVGEDACSTTTSCQSNTGSCCYDTDDELRYIVIY